MICRNYKLSNESCENLMTIRTYNSGFSDATYMILNSMDTIRVIIYHCFFSGNNTFQGKAWLDRCYSALLYGN